MPPPQDKPGTRHLGGAHPGVVLRAGVECRVKSRRCQSIQRVGDHSVRHRGRVVDDRPRDETTGPSAGLRVVDRDPAGGHAVENAPGMRKYRVAYETEPRD